MWFIIRRIGKALVLWLVKDNRPADIVSGEGLKEFMKEVVPRFNVPHRTTLKAKMGKMYESALDYIRNELLSVKFIALTTDAWTDSMNNRSYLGTTAHYVKNFKHHSFTVGVSLLDEAHTSEYLKNVLNDLIYFWNIDQSKIVCCVTDNASNMVKAIDLFLGKDRHVGCFAHTLNLIVKDTIRDVAGFANIVCKLKRIVTYFHKSNLAAAELDKLQKKEKMMSGKVLKLKQEVETRWNSTYIMIERFLLLKDIVSLCLQNSPDAPDMILGSEMKILEDGMKLLKPFFQITSEISSESHATISKVIPLVGILVRAINKVSLLTSVGQDFQQKIHANIDKRFKHYEMKNLYSVATLLDPRFKKFDFKSRSCCANAIAFVNAELKNTEIHMSPTATSHPVNCENEEDIWSCRDAELVQAQTMSASITTSTGLHTSLKSFLDATAYEHNSDPLCVWEKLQTFNPSLCELALKFLTSPATSVPAERLFSKAGNTINKKRCNLDPKYLEKLLILNSLPMNVLKTLKIHKV